MSTWKKYAAVWVLEARQRMTASDPWGAWKIVSVPMTHQKPVAYNTYEERVSPATCTWSIHMERRFKHEIGE